jgi:hypothetical protein
MSLKQAMDITYQSSPLKLLISFSYLLLISVQAVFPGMLAVFRVYQLLYDAEPGNLFDTLLMQADGRKLKIKVVRRTQKVCGPPLKRGL